MSLVLPFLLLAEVAAMPVSPIDPQRVEAELAADADIIRSLNENGDVPSIRRSVDVRFVGPAENIALLERQIWIAWLARRAARTARRRQ